MLKKSFLEEVNSLLNEKMKMIVLFIIPIMVVLLMGVELNNETITDIPMAVIDYDHTNFSATLIDSFDQDETFVVKYYPETEQELERLMRDSKIRIGMIIPKDFYRDVVGLKSPSVMMLYDGSHMSMTSVTKSKAMEILLTYKAGATINQLMNRLDLPYFQAYNLTQAFQFNNRMLYNPSKSFEDFLAPILIAGVIQTSIVLLASVAIDHDIFYEARRTRKGYATGKVIFYTLAGSISFLICSMIQVYIFGIPFRGRFIDLWILSLVFCFAVSSFNIVISTVIKNRMIALIGGSIIFIPNSIMAGTTWPLIAMPLGYQGFAKFIPFTHFVSNFRSIYLKGIDLSQMSSDMMYMLIFGLASICVAEGVLHVLVLKGYKEVEHNDSSVTLKEALDYGV